jgi:cytochrome c
MRIQNILLASLFVSLYGCQPEAPAPKTVAPAAVEPPPVVQNAVQPAANEAPVSAPVQKIEPAPPEKTTKPPEKEKITAVVKEKTPPAVVEKTVPVQEIAVPVAKAATETKSEPVISEADAMQLARKNNCLACHAVEKKVVGPSFKDVAAKYRGDAGAEARLADKIAKGGSGVWGAMAMPPSPQIGETDRKTLAKFVLSLK